MNILSTIMQILEIGELASSGIEGSLSKYVQIGGKGVNISGTASITTSPTAPEANNNWKSGIALLIENALVGQDTVESYNFLVGKNPDDSFQVATLTVSVKAI